MKLTSLQLQEYEYLPPDLLSSFAKSYARSFPEFSLDSNSLIGFLNRKFPTIGSKGLHNIAVLANEEGVVASGYGIVRNYYSHQNQDFNVGLVCDVFTDANFRKMGLFKKVSLLAIAREELTDTKFLIGFPIREEVMPGHLSVGWRYLFDMPLWWAYPRLGSTKNIQKNPTLSSTLFKLQSEKFAIKPTTDFLKWRYSFFGCEYYLIVVSDSEDFALVRKSKLKGLPFTCIVFMQSSSKENSRVLIRKVRNLSLRLRTFGVVGCWNNGYATELFLYSSGLKKSSKVQKVIVRELNGFTCPNEEDAYRLSWMDSDTL